MKKSKRSLLQQKEELLVRIESQDQRIAFFEREIYENVSQVLCLARLNLSTVNLDDRAGLSKVIEHSGDLIAQAISDLRNLAKTTK
jgi:hypothetical protein